MFPKAGVRDMPVTTRRTASTGQGDETIEPESVELPMLDLPEWAENTLQVVSFGAFTPRSAERRAVEAAARLRLEASVDVAVELDYEDYQGGSADLPSPPQPRKSPRLLDATTTLRALEAKEATARIKARALAESAAAARVAAAADSDEVDDIISARAAQLKRDKKKDKAKRSRDAKEAVAKACEARAVEAAESAAAAETARQLRVEASDPESDTESGDDEPVTGSVFGMMKRGPLQAALVGSGRPELAAFGETMRRIDVVEIDDFFLMTYEQMAKEVKKVKEKISLAAYTKVRKAVEIAQLEAGAGVAADATVKLDSDSSRQSSDDDEPKAVAALLAAAGPTGSKRRVVPTSFVPGVASPPL